MRLGIVSLMSAIHGEREINRTLSPFYDRLEGEFDLEEINESKIDEVDFDEFDLIGVFVKTGGTENQFKQIYSKFPGPVYLLSTPLHNSLPASLEILTWVKSRDGRGRIIHGGPDQIVEQIKESSRLLRAEDMISRGKLGVVGRPSDWLIASDVDYKEVEKRWGLELVDVDLASLYSSIESYDSADVAVKVEELVNQTVDMVENDKADITDALRVYFALQDIVNEQGLTALTLRCFNLVTDLNTTGCVALSLLNDQGVIAGCEGDIPATFTMMVSNYLTDELPFMANPVEIDPGEERVIFAHCTVPTEMTEEYILRSHFESGIGVGIQGIINPGPVTVVKVGGNSLEDLFVAEGLLTDNLTMDSACRTQISVDFEGAVSRYFLNDPIANHHVIIPGKWKDLIEKFMERS